MTEDNNREEQFEDNPSSEASGQDVPPQNLEEEVWGAPPLDEKVPNPGGDKTASQGDSSLSQEETDALVKGLEGLDFLSEGIPEIPNLESGQEDSPGEAASQGSIDDIIASVQGTQFDLSDDGSSQPAPAQTGTETRPASFPALESGPVGFSGEGSQTLSLLMDIPVQLSVVLGRARKTIGEILALEAGSIVELDRLAGEPVDVLANGRLILKGEVVVIDESFGIRVTELVSKL